MNISAAIVSAALIIGASIMLASHWSVQAIGAGRPAALRLNNWTGEVVWCAPAGQDTRKLTCESK
ncbi:hypothetical protein B2M20_10730 [Nitrobacter vulgaris]|uniref:Uncharacterized protein n=1 Tax=Nitrobacter vulgaris TaxID=29421 RepID=A0A1V4HYB2_NITVU|nr:hypothetical protein B2M20_10730 [Nitrobacter vulgaris]